MEIILLSAAGGLGVALVILLVAVARQRAQTRNEPQTVDLSKTAASSEHHLSPTERSFLNALQHAVGTNYYIFAKVPLADLVLVSSRQKPPASFLQKIQGRKVDFVLCEPAKALPVIAISLDYSSDQRPDQRTQQSELQAILKKSGLPLLRVKAGAKYDPREVARGLYKLI